MDTQQAQYEGIEIILLHINNINPKTKDMEKLEDVLFFIFNLCAIIIILAGLGCILYLPVLFKTGWLHFITIPGVIMFILLMYFSYPRDL